MPTREPSANLYPLHATGLDARWRQAIVQGNEAFELGDDALALAKYQFALQLAYSEPAHWPGPDHAIAALVVSCHNLADLHTRRGEPELAARRLCEAHERLAVIAADETSPPSLRLAAQRHGRRAYVELLRFAQRYPELPGIARALALGTPTPTDLSGHDFDR